MKNEEYNSLQKRTGGRLKYYTKSSIIMSTTAPQTGAVVEKGARPKTFEAWMHADPRHREFYIQRCNVTDQEALILVRNIEAKMLEAGRAKNLLYFGLSDRRRTLGASKIFVSDGKEFGQSRRYVDIPHLLITIKIVDHIPVGDSGPVGRFLTIRMERFIQYNDFNHTYTEAVCSVITDILDGIAKMSEEDVRELLSCRQACPPPSIRMDFE